MSHRKAKRIRKEFYQMLKDGRMPSPYGHPPVEYERGRDGVIRLNPFCLKGLLTSFKHHRTKYRPKTTITILHPGVTL